MPQETIFSQDSESTNEGKNNKLSALLAGAWNDLAIVRIERIEAGSQSGWQATYNT